jgi:DNA polymerase-3 subunit gamma/tau
VLEIDGASNRGIDEVRELRESAKYQPMRDRFRIFIIDEVHMLTQEAFNALLKILEEPPPHVFFIFATTELRKVPATILSRCQLFEFKRIPDRILVQRLAQITAEEKIEIPEKGLEMIATASEGGLRDALGTLDQITAFSGTKIDLKDVEAVLGLVDAEIMLELGDAICRGNSGEVVSILNRISEFGTDYRVFYNELLAFYRTLFLLRFSSESSDDPRLAKLAQEYEEIHLLRICHQLLSIQSLLRLSGNLRFLFEVTLVKLSQIRRLVPLEELADSLKKNPSFLAGTTLAAKVPEPNTIQTSESPAPGPETIGDDFFALLISELETHNPRLAAALEGAKFHRENSKIRFFVPETHFRRMKLDEKDQLHLQKLLQQKLGAALQVEIQKGAPPEEKNSGKVATPETLVQNDPVVQEFVRIFKGKIGKIELNKGSGV